MRVLRFQSFRCQIKTECSVRLQRHVQSIAILDQVGGGSGPGRSTNQQKSCPYGKRFDGKRKKHAPQTSQTSRAISPSLIKALACQRKSVLKKGVGARGARPYVEASLSATKGRLYFRGHDTKDASGRTLVRL